MDSLVMSRPCTFCNTTVGCRLERRRALWRIMLGYTDRAPTFAWYVYLACRHQRAAKTQCAPHIPFHHDRACWELSRSIAVMGCGGISDSAMLNSRGTILQSPVGRSPHPLQSARWDRRGPGADTPMP